MPFPDFTSGSQSLLEKEMLDRWAQQDIFRRSIEERDGAEPFTFFEGPPTANGRPGIHHVMARTIKDAFCRYKTMKGFRVDRKAGWDTHGLPVEIEVEKQLGLTGRHQVEEYGIEAYNNACRESVLKYKDLWDTLTTRMGYWVDLDNPYVTFETPYIESVWWLLKTIHDKGFMYKGHKIQWYSPGSGTVLSSHEVSLGYKEVQDPSVYVRFPVAGETDTYFLAWTTTPWTLISNVALCVGPSIEYVKLKVEHENGVEHLILAEALRDVVKEPAEIVETYRGSDLVGMRYTGPFDYFADEIAAGNGWRVVPANYVSTSDGTGIVHTAPAFGADDHMTAAKEGLPVVNPVLPDGTFSDAAPLVKGMWFKDADKPIVRDLKERRLMFRHETCVHNYPHDWRKGTPLMSYPVESWFIRTTAVKDRLIGLNKQIDWQPAGIGEGRFGEWLANNVDWALSRRRYWGTPLPIWESDAPGSTHYEIIGSIDELRDRVEDLPGDDALDLHRPFVDGLTWAAPDGGTMRRVEDLIDVWFDSGSMPFAQWHYPFENKDRFEANFPGDFIAEGVDQTRGWFYTLHAIATLVMDDVAYKNVVVNGLVLDEKGDKMSKSKGNTVDPFEVIENYGADVVRWYMMSNTPPWENIKFSIRNLESTQRKFFNTLTNVYGFFATYANIDNFDTNATLVSVEERPELDRWILSRADTTIERVDEAYSAYNPTRAARGVEQLVDDLSNWYVRRSRRRFWKSETDSQDKLAAYQTIHSVLLTVSKLMSPIAPFVSDWLYTALTGNTSGSVHLERMPSVSAEIRDAELEHRIGLARTISSITLALRNDCGLNVRRPLSKIVVVTGPATKEEDVLAVEDIILEEVNVKAIEFISSSSGVVKRSAKPNFKTLGKRLGPAMKAVNQLVRNWSDEEIQSIMDNGSVVVDLENGQQVTLNLEDVEIVSEGVEDWLVAQEDGVTVALDTHVTNDLRMEGLARESVNRIQNLRKKVELDVTDRIVLGIKGSEAIVEAIREHREWIMKETLSTDLVLEALEGEAHKEEFVIDEHELTVDLRPEST